MKYLYYPGCSLEGSAREYDQSTRACLKALGAELIEIDDWTCCGASAAEATSQFLSLALPARNLALAEAMDPDLAVLVPCSACYLNLKKTVEIARSDAAVCRQLNETLQEEHLHFHAKTKVRHLLDVLACDVDPQAIRHKVSRPLCGLTIAPYYGCQCLRPFVVFDDPEAPRSMEPLIAATGAAIHPWSMGGRCCGASHMNTKMQVGLELSGRILAAARGADAIVTVCPMCQMNLEAHQKKISRLREKPLAVTILYLPQLLGLAMGLDRRQLGLDQNLAVGQPFLAKLNQPAAVESIHADTHH
jgi:heterodisulfide reductase subunit B2